MKVWCVPVSIPDPEQEPEQAEAARKFIQHMDGLKAVSMVKNSIMMLAFETREKARAAKWKFEEFSTAHLDIIECSISKDGKILQMYRVLKGE